MGTADGENDVTRRGGMTEHQEEALRGAARGWLDAGDELAAAVRDGDDPAAIMELAERATLARLTFRQTLIELGWRPPVDVPHSG